MNKDFSNIIFDVQVLVLLVFRSALSKEYDLISINCHSKVRIYNSRSRPFRLRRYVPQDSVLEPFFFSPINALPAFFLQPIKSPSMLTILLFRPFPQTLNMQPSLSRLLSTYWVEWSSK